MVNILKLYNNIYVLLYMFNFFKTIYYYLIDLCNLTEEQIEKINKRLDKNNLYIEYI